MLTILPFIQAWESEVITLWPSLIEIVNITEAHFGPEPDSFSERIAEEAVRKWHEFVERSPLSPDLLNDAFYKYQHRLFQGPRGKKARGDVSKPHQNVTWPELEQLSEYQKLRGYIETFGRRYLHRLGYLDTTTGFDIFSWAAINSHSDFHGPHTHTGELMVGVYYAKVNEGSGRLRLFDPRGQIVPFGKVYDFSCQSGQMILFPSWLQHAALPTKGSDNRVVFAFNIGIGGKGDYKTMEWDMDPVAGHMSSRKEEIPPIHLPDSDANHNQQCTDDRNVEL